MKQTITSQYEEGANLHPNVKETISGFNEAPIRSLIESLGYFENRNFIWQYPIGNYVLDFAFPDEMICIEADGKEHKLKKNIMVDFERDNFLYSKGWVVIRIDTTKLDSYHLSFYRNLIREVVEERKV